MKKVLKVLMMLVTCVAAAAFASDNACSRHVTLYVTGGGKMIISHHGINALKRSKVDPRIIFLWYGTDKDVLKPSESYSELETLYDSNGPLNVTGTGWNGTPCVSKSGLGGLVHNNGGNWLQLNKGLHWRQPEVLSQLDKSKPWTFEFWLRNDYGNTGNFGDGDWCVSFMSKQGSDITMGQKDSDGVVPCPAISGWYGSLIIRYIYNGSYLSYYTLASVFGNSLKWVHFAMTYNGNGNKSGLRLFAGGTEIKDRDGNSYGNSFNDAQFGWMFKDLQAVSIVTAADNTCNWRIAQICLMNYVRYTKNFTPQTKPYFLGLDDV